MTTLQDALRQFEAAEANLAKLEALWGQIRGLIPDSPVFGAPPEYEAACFAFRRSLPSLPAIDGFRIDDNLLDFDDIGQMRVDEIDVGDIEIAIRTNLRLALTLQRRQWEVSDGTEEEGGEEGAAADLGVFG